MKEVINAVGTLVTIVALVMALIVGSSFLKVLAGIGIVYVMYFHDENLKTIWEKEATDEYNAGVDAYNAEVDKYNHDDDDM